MIVKYSLSLEDHEGWYDRVLLSSCRLTGFQALLTRFAPKWRKSMFLNRLRANKSATGERVLEVSSVGARESGANYDFVTLWKDVVRIEQTPNHLFIAHHSLNAHIVPLNQIGDAAKDFCRTAIMFWITENQKKAPNKAPEPR